MKAFELVQSLYIIVFGLVLARRGFAWNWFLPLAGAFLVLTLLTVPEISGPLLSGPAPADPTDRTNLVAAPMLLIFYPLHAYVTVQALRRLPQKVTAVESWVLKTGIYLGSAIAAGFLWTLFMGAIMLIIVALR